MSPPSSPDGPPPVFRLITIVLALVTLLLLAWGLGHISGNPEIVGRYSRNYALLLAGLAGVAGLLWASVLRPRGSLTRFLTNAYLLIGTTVVALLAVEWGMRIVNPWGVEFFHNLPYHMQGMVDDPELGYVHPKSVSYYLGRTFVSLNSRGLRDEEISPSKPAGERRILALGDSVTFGWGVSQGETFADKMEPLLRQRTGIRWQVINAGVNGYNTEQEAAWLRLHGMAYDPDIVLLTYVANDADPIVDPNETIWRRFPTWPDSLPELVERIRSLSYLYQVGKLMKVARERQEAREQFSQTGLMETITSHARWPRSRAALAEIAHRCRVAGIPFVVAQQSATDPAFLNELKTLGIDVISFKGVSADVPIDQAYVSRVDPHPGALVHHLIAKHLVDELDRRGWLRQIAK